MSIAVTLSIPHLLNPLRLKEANSALAGLKLPALQTMLAKGDIFPAKVQNSFEQASYLFHQPKATCYASVMAAAELDDYDGSVYWLRVDPVQMIADRDSLVLIPARDIAITEDESLALLEAFNTHFADDRVSLEFASSYCWYLRIVQPIDLQTHSLESVAYKHIDDCYPTGNAAGYWRKMINETQMLFFSHPVNESRRERGMPEINSIWVWGEGQLDQSTMLERENSMVWSDNTYLKGLAKLANAKSAPSPESFEFWAGGGALQDQAVGHHMIQLDPLANTLDNMQEHEWLEALKQLEDAWLDPMLAALKAKQIDSLLLDLGNGFRYHLKPGHLSRFWRFKKQLSKI
ncbi:MAG: hypothetical protein ISEC1_P1307 [Thiomicrorhabdus sp.]|nr:MAG: hypothetical protein ISEC1_P1307 [Thiomicrorhabdus sp.]